MTKGQPPSLSGRKASSGGTVASRTDGQVNSEIVLDLGGGKTLRVEAPGADGDKLQYVRSVKMDGSDYTSVWLDWERLSRGGTIRFDLADEPPAKGWGTNPADLPPPLCPSPAR